MVTAELDDPIRRAWARLFVGDAPGNRTLIGHSDETVTVTELVADGGTTSRSFTLGGEVRTVEVPSTVEHLVVDRALPADVADALEQRHTSEQDAASASMSAEDRELAAERDAGWRDYFAAQERLEQALVRTTEPLGTVAAWLDTVAGDDPFVGAVARGEDHPCQRCVGEGRAHWLTCGCVPFDLDAPADAAPDPTCSSCEGEGKIWRVCERCAGSGMRRSSCTITVVDAHGAAVDVLVDASKLTLSRVTTVGVRTPGGPSQTYVHYDVDAAPIVGELRAGGLDLPADGTVVLRTAGLARRTDGTRTVHGARAASPAQAADAQAATRVARAALRFMPAGSHPDLNAGWRDITPEEALRDIAEADFDDAGRVCRRRVEVVAPIAPVDAWLRLCGVARRVEAALPDGWRVQLWLRTGFIATGEHGPELTLLALPPHLYERPVAIAQALDHRLEATFDQVIYDVEHLDAATAAEDVLDRAGR